MNLIFLGPPGSGKGTQSSMLAKMYGICKLSTGDIFREVAKENNEIGLKVKSIIDSGAYVPDDIVIDVLTDRITRKDCDNGFILDGFPRTMFQAESLEKILLELGKKIDVVLELKVDDQILIDRISGRFSCKNCGAAYNSRFKCTRIKDVCDDCGGSEFVFRKDDGVDTISARLKIYHEQTAKLLDYYRSKSILYSINGMADICVVSEQVKLIVKLAAKMLT